MVEKEVSSFSKINENMEIIINPCNQVKTYRIVKNLNLQIGVECLQTPKDVHSTAEFISNLPVILLIVTTYHKR